MSLFSSLRIGTQSILTNQAALQVVGHNMANASTPGYSRQRVDLVTLPPNQSRFGPSGAGVTVARIQRLVDQSLQSRSQDANSSLGSLRVRQETLSRLEGLMQELGDGSLSDRIGRFFAAIEEVANAPERIAPRTAAIEQGKTLTEQIQSLAVGMRDVRKELDRSVRVQVDEINAAGRELAELNEQVLAAETSGLNFDTANDLRDRREQVMRELAEKVNVKGIETPQGALNVLIGSNYLVYGRQAFEIDVTDDVLEGAGAATPFFRTSGAALELRSGSLQGTVEARDSLVLGFEHDLNTLARALAFQFNRVHSTGLGLARFDSITSVNGVHANSVAVGAAPLATFATAANVSSTTSFRDPALVGWPDDRFVGLEVEVLSGANAGLRRRVVDFDGATGTVTFDESFPEDLAVGTRVQLTSLPHAIDNGSFDLRVVNELTGKIDVINIEIDVDGLPAPPPSGDSTLDSVVAEINAEAAALFGAGTILASRTADNQLRIESTSDALSLGFGTDTSGFLAAIGLNTFFTGRDAATLGVNPLLEANPRLLAAADGIDPGDNRIARALADLRHSRLLDGGTAGFEEFYQGVVGDLAVQTQTVEDRTAHQELLAGQIDSERQRISGVNLDEEAVNLVTYQRAFQASARYLSVIDELLSTLINSV